MDETAKLIKGPGQGSRKKTDLIRSKHILSLTLTEFCERWKTAELIKIYYEAEANKTVVLSHRQRLDQMN